MKNTVETNGTLTTILHDPENRHFELAKKSWGMLSSYYPHICVAATMQVADEFIEFLNDNGVIVDQSNLRVGDGRRKSLQLALMNEPGYIHYSDFDRIIHWINTNPAELGLVASTMNQSDFLILGRTDRAFVSHPRVQQIAERITNKAFSIAYGQETDVTSGSCAMSKNAAEIILEQSTSDSNDTDTEWPLLVAKAGLVVNYEQFEGLEFETPDFYATEIEAAGSYENWLDETYNTSKMWEQRMRLAEKSIDKILELS